MRKMAICLLIVPLLLGGTLDLSNNGKPNVEATDDQPPFRGQIEVFSFEEGVRLSDLIVEVEILEKQEGAFAHPTPKSIFELKIIRTQKQDSTLNSDVIYVMQQGGDKVLFNNNALFKPGDKYILFLKKVFGPTAEQYPDLYWILGENSNMYKDLGNDTMEKMGYVDPSLTELQLWPNARESATQLLNKLAFIEKIQDLSGYSDQAADPADAGVQRPVKCGLSLLSQVEAPLTNH